MKIDMNEAIEKLVVSSGVKTNILQQGSFDQLPGKGETDQTIDAPVCIEDEWNEERERMAQELLNKDTSMIKPFWADKYDCEANKYWDQFYMRNRTNFYKDRHYLQTVFPDLAPQEGTDAEPRTLLEVGCGVGNGALPLLEVNPLLQTVAIDFSSKAIELLQQQPLYDKNRCEAHVCDITKDNIHEMISKKEGVDFALFMFCLSAIHPEKMKDAIKNVANVLKPGGKIFFRDYGRYDQAQLRFKPGHKLQENFYVRQDCTRAYYFTTEEVKELFESVGLHLVENMYIRRQYANRLQEVVRYRVWIHAIFMKPATLQATS